MVIPFQRQIEIGVKIVNLISRINVINKKGFGRKIFS